MSQATCQSSADSWRTSGCYEWIHFIVLEWGEAEKEGERDRLFVSSMDRRLSFKAHIVLGEREVKVKEST